LFCSPQVSISEFLAIPAKDALTFHVLYSTTAADLEAEIQAGGAPFTCEFYNQVRQNTRPCLSTAAMTCKEPP
jgi:hypothetical protein